MSCPVEIDLDKSAYDHLDLVQPRLSSHGPSVIYIPRWPSRGRGFRVERIEDGAEVKTQPQVSSFDRNQVLAFDPIVYSFESPELIGQVSDNVTELTKDGQGWIPPGRFRLSPTFATFDPRTDDCPSVPLCTVYSRPFVTRFGVNVVRF